MRTKKLMISTLAETIPYIILGIIGFVKVKILIDYLGSDLNGYYQFINQIIAYLFLIEAGFGRAVIYKLYKPFASHDQHKISMIFKGSRTIFRNIGFIILGFILLALVIIPIIFSIKTVYLFPVLFSFGLISSAYLIAYFGKSNAYYALFCADQKKYVYSLIFNILKIVDDLLIIVLAIYFKSLIPIAIIIFIIKIIEELTIRYFGKKHFPFLDKKAKSDTSSFKMTKDLVWHQVSFLVANNADIIILMYFMSPLIVSIYATYNFIARFLNELTTRINNVVSYAFGNMFAKEQDERSYQIVDEYFIASTFLAFTIALTFTLGIRPFVSIWINNVDYYLSFFTVILFGFNLFLWTIYSPLVAVINAKGLYKESKWLVVISAIINVILSIVFVNMFKDSGVSAVITAVLTATVISNIINIILRIRLVKAMVFTKTKTISIISEYLVFSVMFLLMTISLQFIEEYLFTVNGIVPMISFIGLIFILTAIIIIPILFITKHNSKMLLSRLIDMSKRKRLS